MPIYYDDTLTTICQCDILALMNKLMLCHRACSNTKISSDYMSNSPFQMPSALQSKLIGWSLPSTSSQKKTNFGVIITELLTEMALS